ncbi:LysE/ArgO family amino acid transporter [Microbacterium halophytorum]|uniref:LysE/ArgO family amino acid transporter n=1 Tax=Microbacterium halophytorum TaxID=2067568 RepID=UPI000CFA8EA3|nr:LysE family transporter [Microbacterium halophytorum]
MLTSPLAGLGLSLSLIAAPGAQNVFLLREGIRHASGGRRHAIVLALVCLASDVVLISAGVAGFGAAVEAVPWLFDAARWAGVVFLAGYGLFAAWRAIRGTGEAIDATGTADAPDARGGRAPGDARDEELALEADGSHATGTAVPGTAPAHPGTAATATLERPRRAGLLLPAVLTCLAITWLNPHTYLDTVLMLGSISTSYAAAPFAIGAILGSAVWFAFITFAARFAARWLRSPRSWRILDAGVAVMMLGLAVAIAL